MSVSYKALVPGMLVMVGSLICESRIYPSTCRWPLKQMMPESAFDIFHRARVEPGQRVMILNVTLVGTTLCVAYVEPISTQIGYVECYVYDYDGLFTPVIP